MFHPLMFAFSVSRIWIRHYVLEKGIVSSGETLPFDPLQLCSSEMGSFLFPFGGLVLIRPLYVASWDR